MSNKSLTNEARIIGRLIQEEADYIDWLGILNCHYSIDKVRYLWTEIERESDKHLPFVSNLFELVLHGRARNNDPKHAWKCLYIDLRQHFIKWKF